MENQLKPRRNILILHSVSVNIVKYFSLNTLPARKKFSVVGGVFVANTRTVFGKIFCSLDLPDDREIGLNPVEKVRAQGGGGQEGFEGC